MSSILSETRPNFFIVGAAKCGTTSMYEYLRPHPDIFMPDYKEPVFFGRDLGIKDCWRIPDGERYHELFSGGAGRKCVGEASVWYLRSESAAREIHQYNPNARILIMLRNPVDFLYSLHGLFLWTDNEDIADFQHAFEAQAIRLQGRRMPKMTWFPLGLQYTQMASFSRQVRRYFDVFGRDRVMVILTDDLKSDLPATYRRVLEFLEVDPDFAPAFEHFNETRPIRQLPLHGLINRPMVRSILQRALPKFSRPARDFMVKALTTVLPAAKRPTRLDPQARQTLLRRFAREIETLGDLIGRDLSHWLDAPAAAAVD